MRHDLLVFVPQDENVSYSLYAYGAKKGFASYSADMKNLGYTFEGGTVVVLFYYFAGFQRAFVVTGWDSERDEDKAQLPGVEGDLLILYTAIGREVKTLLRLVKLFTLNGNTSAFTYPLIFWYRLCALIRCKKAQNSNVGHLIVKTKELL